MRNLLGLNVVLTIILLLTACSQTSQSSSTVVPSFVRPTITPAAIPSPFSTLSVEITPTQVFVPPTLIPTIDPAVVPELLSKAFFIQFLDGPNGHNIRQITGWDYGLGGGYRFSCPPFQWMDEQHLLLFPATGQVYDSAYITGVNIVHQPVIINFESGHTWLPYVNQVASPLSCNGVYWSKELGMVLRPGNNSSAYDYNDRPAIFTYTLDGQDINHYWGKLLTISPSGTKILVDDDTVIDLTSNKIIELAWYMNYDSGTSRFFWSSDETRIYRCCHQYADITTGRSYSFDVTELRSTNGEPARSTMLPFTKGQWVRNDTFFLVEWSWIDDGDIRYLPMFDPARKIIYDVRAMAGISEDLTCPETSTSPTGEYVWIMCYGGDYLVNLFNFESTAYPGYSQMEINWSADGQSAWLNDFINDKIELLSLSNKELTTLSPYQVTELSFRWHPIGGYLASLSTDNQVLEILNSKTMSTEKLVLPLSFRDLIWSPTGEKIALVAVDGSLWQVDFPTLENLEQLTSSFTDVQDAHWSPDGNSIAIVSGSNIYIVEITK
ncbi:MAG: DPP IV N-terminal domain-containing protein [Anaerolineae bacterium]|nr:DPP IV N-terminal domain-containing protein [Anaerolineae bacterium]MBL8107660.1 DPP IV N-terminal domain-containing protein [Anaerolineales bacterium]MCC7190037.1 DPP IV N-terminal domain-containing protein [Anaerolineales bacterium]